MKEQNQAARALTLPPGSEFWLSRANYSSTLSTVLALPADQRAEDQRADDQRAEDQRAEDQRAEDQRAEDQRADVKRIFPPRKLSGAGTGALPDGARPLPIR
jgi:hypothetical protein